MFAMLPILNADSYDNKIVLSTIYDEYISDKDSRIMSIMFAAKHNLWSYIQVEYNGHDGFMIANNLIKTFDKNQIHYAEIESPTMDNRKLVLTLIQNIPQYNVP